MACLAAGFNRYDGRPLENLAPRLAEHLAELFPGSVSREVRDLTCTV
jgi:hypothetical protein